VRAVRAERQDVLDEELVVGHVGPDLALLPLDAKGWNPTACSRAFTE
jgi:hypothetical protein